MTPGLVDLGKEEANENYAFGAYMKDRADNVILVGEKNTEAIYRGLKDSGFDMNNVKVVNSEKEAKRKELIDKYSTLFEIKDDLGQPIASYSHGMKQKLAIISAWLHEPKLILMDEPFVGLDPKASHLLKEMMKEFCEKGNAIFFSTHVLEVAEKLCDKVAIIKDGKLVKSGTMEDIKGDASLETVFLELEGDICD